MSEVEHSITAPVFAGQQSDERILYTVRPHWLRRIFTFIGSASTALVVGYITFFVFGVRTSFEDSSYVYGIIIGLITFVGWMWWGEVCFDKEKTFITDRRVIRIQASFPIFEKRRAIFWNEAAKAKGYAPNVLFRFLKIGTIRIQPVVLSLEDITIRWVFYFDDLANYIDKVLYTQKNRPQEMNELRPFITKPKGQRY